MPLDKAMQLVGQLQIQAEALAAFAAYVQLSSSTGVGDFDVRTQLDRVIRSLNAAELAADLSQEERSIASAFARSYLRQALDLIDDPARPGAWTYDDPILLQAQGAASAIVASLFVQAGIGKPDARILDVGTGVAGLAIAFCRTFPDCTVVGIDPWEPALKLARQNVEKAELESRITLLPAP